MSWVGGRSGSALRSPHFSTRAIRRIRIVCGRDGYIFSSPPGCSFGYNEVERRRYARVSRPQFDPMTSTRERYLARNLMAACVPSQNGLLLDSPQRHSVTRSRASYSSPSAAISAIPPRNQIGPLQASAGSSISPIEGADSGSSAVPVFLSHTTRRPDGQFWTCRMNIARTSESAVPATWLHTWPFGSQNRANAHKLSTSSSAREGPSNTFARSRHAARSATVKVDLCVGAVAERLLV